MSAHDVPQFGGDFLWGTSTSSYQIEGAADADGRGVSIWDTFSHRPGRVRDAGTGDVACDHYHRWESDLDLLAWLGGGMYRFSVAWPRIQPRGHGPVEPRGLAFYDRLVDGLLARGIAPMVTLYHWDLPQALEDAGGWTARETVDRFVEYAVTVAEALGDRVRWWNTINEPWCSAMLGYGNGSHAPGRAEPGAAVAATHHLLLAHGRAVRALRPVLGADAQLGIALNPAPIRPASSDADDTAAARLADGVRNRAFLDPLVHARYPDDVLAAWEPFTAPGLVRDGDLEEIAAPLDLLGLNYYNPVLVRARTADEGPGGSPPEPGLASAVQLQAPGPQSGSGWTIDPSGLEELLLRIAADVPGVPLFITENGAAFPDKLGLDGEVDDGERIDYLDGHLRAAGRAVAAGVDLRGYLVWSLMDNFEWAEGYTQQFGLVHVDRDTLARVPKRSAHWYRDRIRAARSAVDQNRRSSSESRPRSVS